MYTPGLMASLYKRGDVFWVKYYRPGSRKPIRASLDTRDEKTAGKKLKILEGELAKGNQADMRLERIRFGHLLDLVLADYVNNERKSLRQTECRIDLRLRPEFGDRRAVTINSADIALYVDKRKSTDEAENGTINRELTLIKKAFTLAWRAYRLPGPYIALLEERNVRAGFFSREQLESLCGHLPDYLVPVARFAFLTGWRIGEIRQLEWRHVDLEAGEIRLDPGTTKNEDGRIFRLTSELQELLEGQKRRESVTLTPAVGVRPNPNKILADRALCPAVFTYLRRGKFIPIGDHRKEWTKACRAAGLPGRIFHDLRRSAVRQFIRDGISERVAMNMTGHKTREIFDRYQIVSTRDLDEARSKTEAAHKRTSDRLKNQRRRAE